MAKRKPTLGSEASLSSARPEIDPALSARAEIYTVLARRYRPQQFKDIIGQEHVAQALVNALQGNRVAHAYLFTGARGVGKTSTARILAKALNCVKSPTATPCDECERCRSIASGEDVDVLEIDGASNRGIDEIREIRQNVQYRPSRARFKIYIIDEVHMLTKEAFNALLKTLEEPPPHVKFIFATTESQKIPLTILSRCQRFDFAGIAPARIVEQLREIVAEEKMKADDEALELIARRAAGSMRDAQSLLDQLLAFGDDRLTAEHVYRLLGTAHIDRVMELAKAVLEYDSKEALELLGRSMDEGLQLGELLDQLIDYWRDLMVINCAGANIGDISLPSRHRDTLVRQTKVISLDTILAGLDVLGATKARLRGSNHGRVLMEMALVRLSRLDDLVSLSQLTQWLSPTEDKRSKIEDRGSRIENRELKIEDRGSKVGERGSTLQHRNLDNQDLKKENVQGTNQAIRADPPSSILDPPSSSHAGSTSPRLRELTEATLPEIWREVLADLGPMLAGNLGKAERVAISGPKTLVVHFPSRYNHERDYCQESSRAGRIQDAIQKVTGQTWTVRVESGGGEQDGTSRKVSTAETVTSNYRRQRAEAGQEPLVKRALDQLGAQIVQVEAGFGSTQAETFEPLEIANIEET